MKILHKQKRIFTQSKVSSFFLMIFFIMFFCFLKCRSLYAQGTMFSESNVVKLTTILENNKPVPGFGIIIYEIDGFLYVVTAEHVVVPDKKRKRIKANFYMKIGDKDADLIGFDPDLGLALLKIEKPKRFVWEFRNVIKKAEIGDRVRIIGREGKWIISSLEFAGRISEVTLNSITADDLYGAAIGTSGGPLINDDGLIGMVTEAETEGSRVYAIPIDLIRKKAMEWLKIEDQNFSDLPIVFIGLNARGLISTLSLFETIYRNPKGLGLGPFFEMAFSKKLGFRIEGAYGNISSGTEAGYSADFRFRNIHYSYSGMLIFYPATPFNTMVPSLYLGYSYQKINPELRTDETRWISLRNMNGFDQEYSDNAHSFRLGFDVNGMLSQTSLIGVGIGFEYTFNRYLFIDVMEPFAENTKNDWIFSINLKCAFLIQSKKSEIKFIR